MTPYLSFLGQATEKKVVTYTFNFKFHAVINENVFEYFTKTWEKKRLNILGKKNYQTLLDTTSKKFKGNVKNNHFME